MCLTSRDTCIVIDLYHARRHDVIVISNMRAVFNVKVTGKICSGDDLVLGGACTVITWSRVRLHCSLDRNEWYNWYYLIRCANSQLILLHCNCEGTLLQRWLARLSCDTACHNGRYVVPRIMYLHYRRTSNWKTSELTRGNLYVMQ